MKQYYIYRLEDGLSVAEQRAADQRIGELAAALTGVRSAVALSLWRELGAVKALGRANLPGERTVGVPASRSGTE
jgi:hypothetical protein